MFKYIPIPSLVALSDHNCYKAEQALIFIGGEERAGCFAWFVFLVSRGGWAALPRGATGLSAVCTCGIT